MDDPRQPRAVRPPDFPPAGPGSRASLSPGLRRPVLWAGSLLIFLVALIVRGHDIDSGLMSPDDGEFLHSAQAQQLDDGIAPVRWIKEDAAWAKGLLDDFGRLEGRATYQHGYLHQLFVRYAVRAGHVLGFGHVAALRLDQAIFGALTVLLVIIWLRRMAPQEPMIALAGGALMALQLAHVALSRTGWGQVACTFFLIWMIMIAWRMHTQASESDTRGLVRGAVGIAVTSLLAYGFHEMATVYTLMLAIIVLLQFGKAPNGTSKWPWQSRRVAFGLVACVPVGVLTMILLLFSEYAQATWFSSPHAGRLSWLEIRTLSLEYLFGAREVLQQISWPILLLAPIGLAGAFTRDMKWLIWLVLWTFLPALFLLLRFENPSLLRIYLPSLVLLCVLAAEGLGVLWAIARHRAAGALADAIAVGAVAWCAATTYTTIFGQPSGPLFVRGVYPGLPEGASQRGAFKPIAAELFALSPAEPVAVAYRWGSAYRVLDQKIAAEIVPSIDARLSAGNPPKYLLAPRVYMEPQGRTVESGGPYTFKAADTYGSIGLYVIEDGQ